MAEESFQELFSRDKNQGSGDEEEEKRYRERARQLEQELLSLIGGAAAAEPATPEAAEKEEKRAESPLQDQLFSLIGGATPAEQVTEVPGVTPAAPQPPSVEAPAEAQPIPSQVEERKGEVKEPAKPSFFSRLVPSRWREKGIAEKRERRIIRKPSRLSLPLILPSLQRVITLSIEGTNLRFLSFARGKVESWGNEPFPARLLREGYVVDPEGMGQVIRSALRSGGITQGKVLCAFPGVGAVSRVLSLPRVAKSELDKVVVREMRRTMALSAETHHLVWQPLPGKGRELKVFLLAVPREPLYAWVHALQAAGLKPQAIDLKPLALARGVNQKDAIIANVESNSIELVIVLNDFPVLMRAVTLGGEAITPEDAAARLLEELDRTLSFYNETNRANPLNPEIAVYLTGELAASSTLVGEVATVTGHPVAPLEPSLRVPKDLPLASFMVNIGLLLKTLR